MFASSLTPRNLQLLLLSLILPFWKLMRTFLFAGFLTWTFFSYHSFFLLFFSIYVSYISFFLNCKHIKLLIWQNYLSAQYLQLFQECYLMLSPNNLTKIQIHSLSKDRKSQGWNLSIYN